MRPPSRQLLTCSLCMFTSLLLVDPGTGLATEPPGPRPAPQTLALATSLVTPFFGAYYLEGKVRVSSSFALIMNTSYLTLVEDDEQWKARAATVGVGAGYFFQGDALRRWYVEAIGEVWLASLRHQPSGEVAPLGLGNAGLVVAGYQFLFDRGPMIDLGAGVVAFHLPSAQVQVAGRSMSSEAFTKVYPAVKVNVGWAF